MSEGVPLMRVPHREAVRCEALNKARRAAEDTLLNGVVLAVSPKAYRQLLKRLDARPRANMRLLRTMQTPAPWE